MNGGSAKTADYGYDNMDQLKTATYSNGFQTNENYGYDANGNRNTNSFTVGLNNRLASDGTFNYTYDNEGNRLTKTRISSATVDDYKTEYIWDYRNRLVGVVLKNNSNAKKKELLYDYDHLNRLVRRKADNDGNGTIDQTDVYAHDGYQIALQFSAASSANLAATNLSRRYLWGDNQDELLADETVSGGVLWAATDPLGSVRDLLRLSGSTTSVANHLTYNAFGMLMSKTSTTAADNTMFAYTGKWTDPVSGLQWNINRWYDAPTGKWISEDPIGFRGKDINLYRYTGNNTVASGDFFGLLSEKNAKRVLDALVLYGGTGAQDGFDYFVRSLLQKSKLLDGVKVVGLETIFLGIPVPKSFVGKVTLDTLKDIIRDVIQNNSLDDLTINESIKKLLKNTLGNALDDATILGPIIKHLVNAAIEGEFDTKDCTLITVETKYGPDNGECGRKVNCVFNVCARLNQMNLLALSYPITKWSLAGMCNYECKAGKNGIIEYDCKTYGTKRGLKISAKGYGTEVDSVGEYSSEEIEMK